MLTWLAAHLADIVILAVIALLVFFVVRGMIRDKKAGKSSCGGCRACTDPDCRINKEKSE